MALNLVDTSYSGTYASYFWLPATYAMDSIQKGILYVQDGIKKTHTIDRLDFSQPLQPRTATPAPNGSTFTQDSRSLTPLDIMVYTEFNPRQYEQNFLAEELSPTLLARELPVTAENYMLQIGLERALEQVENAIWQGSTTYTAAPGSLGNGQLVFFDGYIKQFVNDTTINSNTNGVTTTTTNANLPNGGVAVPLSAAPTTSSVYNIADAFSALLTLAASNTKALLSRPTRYERMKFLVSINTEQIWDTFITTTQTFKGVNTTDKGINKFKGYEIVPLAGMPDNTIVFCEAIDDTTSALYLGMNSMEDNNLQLMRLQNNSELFFLKGLMKYAVQYKFSQEIYLFTTLTTSTFTA